MVSESIHRHDEVKKDLIIGGADKYNWNNVRNWVKSIRATNFDGDIVLVAYRISDDIIRGCEEHGVTVISVGWDSWGNNIIHEQMNRDTQSHQLRFFHIWQLLQSNDQYNNIIITDVRDVIFQLNPSEWLNQHFKYHQIVAPSEGVTFGTEAWNRENVNSAFGPYVTKSLENNLVFNVGTIAGEFEAIKNLCLTIYLMGFGHQIPNDQAAFNLLVNGMIKDITLRVDMRDSWACQCGTALDPEKSYLKDTGVYTDIIPTIRDGIVYAGDIPFTLVHQYDRVPGLVDQINERYR